MINFDEEVKKFKPSLEIEQAEEAIYNNDLTDIKDILDGLLHVQRTDSHEYTTDKY